jgi:hypothetical protein
MMKQKSMMTTVADVADAFYFDCSAPNDKDPQRTSFVAVK